MDAPKIAERVKFWQEQDRINQALIPRVIKIHEIVTELSKTVAGVSEAIAAVEARVTEESDKKLSKLQSDLGSYLQQDLGALRKVGRDGVGQYRFQAEGAKGCCGTTAARLSHLPSAVPPLEVAGDCRNGAWAFVLWNEPVSPPWTVMTNGISRPLASA